MTNLKWVLVSMCLVVAACTPQEAKDVRSVAKTVNDAARIACEVAFGERPPPAGLSIKEICATHQQLAPFIDAILAARQEVGVGLGEPSGS